MSRRYETSGFSLVEVMVATLVMGGLLVAAMTAVGAATTGRAIAAQQATGHALARELMAEIIERPYAEGAALGLDAGESDIASRASFDDVDDYTSYNESGVRARDGTTLAATGFTRSADVRWARLDAPAADATAETGLKRVTVTVRCSGRVAAELVALRSRARPDAATAMELPQ